VRGLESNSRPVDRSNVYDGTNDWVVTFGTAKRNLERLEQILAVSVRNVTNSCSHDQLTSRHAVPYSFTHAATQGDLGPQINFMR